MSATGELLANNEAYRASFDKGDLALPPGRKVAVIACMDARLNVYGALGLSEGDAHVIRNAGGVVTDDKICSLAISRRLLATEEIILIHHTDVRQSIARIKASPFIPRKESIRGFIYEVETGRLREVV